jgi:hypothetical protein
MENQEQASSSIAQAMVCQDTDWEGKYKPNQK